MRAVARRLLLSPCIELVGTVEPNPARNFSAGTGSEGAMIAHLSTPDVILNYHSLGMDQLVGTAADVANLLVVLFVVAISVICLSPEVHSQA
jgi:hypothetical protein